MPSPFVSWWRCDSCGEGCTMELEPVLMDEDGEVIGTAPSVDLVIEAGPPCRCGAGPMRRLEEVHLP